MKRRSFVKSMGLFGSSVLMPSVLGGFSLSSQVQANSLNERDKRNFKAAILGEVDYIQPTVMPQVISIYLYGGPSELAGNLTNIEDINFNSQNSYDSALMPDDAQTRYTANGLWGDAGGVEMERMLEKNRLSIYRTIHRIKEDTKAHRLSIFSNLTGMIGVDDARPGIATTLGSILSANEVITDESIFPFASFEGESLIFNQGDTTMTAMMKPISLNQNLNNPYERLANRALNTNNGDPRAAIDALAKATIAQRNKNHSKVIEAFEKREEIAGFVSQLKDNLDNASLPPDPDFIPPENDPNAEAPALRYPNNFGQRLEAAVNLVINNPDTKFVSLGSSGLGGWDDHNAAMDEYPARMRNLMESLEVAAKHLEATGKDNVIITVYGDFGRNVNLNGSLGWDHGNNQNLYMVGASPSAGSGISGNELGKIVGKTQRIGQKKVNRQFTSPTDDSYQCEPFAIASTYYKYFGIQNPELLSGESAIDETGTPNEWINPFG